MELIINELNERIKNKLTDANLVSLKSECQRILKKYVNDCRIVRENKLRRLGYSTYNNSNVVLKLTDRKLIDAEVKILSRDLQFCISPKSVNTLNIRSELEAFSYKISRNNLTCEQQTKIKQSLHVIDRNYDRKRLKKLLSNITNNELWNMKRL